MKVRVEEAGSKRRISSTSETVANSNEFLCGSMVLIEYGKDICLLVMGDDKKKPISNLECKRTSEPIGYMVLVLLVGRVKGVLFIWKMLQSFCQ